MTTLRPVCPQVDGAGQKQLMSAPGAEAEVDQRVTALLSWERMATRAYAENTRRAWAADWAIFLDFCSRLTVGSLPAEPMTVREFVLDRVRAGKKPASIHRYLATITRAHQAIRAQGRYPCRPRTRAPLHGL